MAKNGQKMAKNEHISDLYKSEPGLVKSMRKTSHFGACLGRVKMGQIGGGLEG